MTARQALLEYLVEQKVLEPHTPPESWFGDGWYRIPIGKRRIPVFPLGRLRPSLTLHDLNHLISGYDLSLRGELQSAAWELGSGGCSRHLFFWVDRCTLVVFGLLLAPRITLAAFRSGLGHRNLYRMNTDVALASEIDELRRWAARA